MKLYKYDSYQQYVDAQTGGNMRKLDRSAEHVKRQPLRLMARAILKPLNPSFGLCHGTRRGDEQRVLREELGCDVLGTEISPTATQFPDTIQWDFHEVKDEWINAADFVYTNSWDHAMDPVKAINNWMRCVKEGGVCVLEYTKWHSKKHVSQVDAFKGNYTSMIDFLKTNFDYGIHEWALNRFYNYIILKHI